jgi:hypothetical protein
LRLRVPARKVVDPASARTSAMHRAWGRGKEEEDEVREEGRYGE